MRSFVRKTVVVVLCLVILVLAALALRSVLTPKETPAPQVNLGPEDLDRLRVIALDSVVTREDLHRRLSAAEVVLVGEVHFYKETTQYLTSLLESVDERPVSLLLEMPSKTQDSIDRYLASGRESLLDEIFADRSVLPYRDIIVWAGEHRDRVSVVVAMDENRQRIVINRAFLRDTRNETMARHVLREKERNPGNLVVAYGGQLHFLMAGRYLYDVENRTPVGVRLVRYGVPREKIVAIMLSGDNESPFCDLAAQGGLMSTQGSLGDEPYPLFVRGAIFRAESARELFDYFVDLNRLSPSAP